jgi:UPF0755 protein
MKRAWAIFALLVLVAALSTMTVPRSYINQPLKTGDEAQVLNVNPGASLGSVAAELHARGWLQYPILLRIYARFSGTAEHIKAGEYDIDPGTTTAQLLELLIAGKVKLHSFTLLEGWTVREMLAALRANPQVLQTLDADDALSLARELPIGRDNAEGLFFPDTYMFAKNTSDRDLLLQAHQLMKSELDAAWSSQEEEGLLKTPYDLLILASIVERESALDRERPEIAGVFMRRMNKRMRLQTDPTVIYGLGTSFDGNLTRKHLQTDNPYNTYTRAGLPPTPIGMPGRSSLRAAALPADGQSLYFVASGAGDGSHVFSNTLEEHNKAVQQYLRKLRQASRKTTQEEG